MFDAVEFFVGFLIILCGARWLAREFYKREHEEAQEIAADARERADVAKGGAEAAEAEKGRAEAAARDEDAASSAGAREAASTATANLDVKPGGWSGGKMPSTSLRDELDI